MRKSFHESLGNRKNQIKSYDSIDDFYMVENEEDKQSEGYYSSSSCSTSPTNKIISRKLVFSEYMIESPDTPDFTHLNQFSDAYLREREKTRFQNISISNQVINRVQSVLVKSHEKKSSSSKRVEFCLSSKENSFQPFQKKQHEIISSDKQLLKMKQALLTNYQKQNSQQSSNESRDDTHCLSQQQDQTLSKQLNNPKENLTTHEEIINQQQEQQTEYIQKTNHTGQIQYPEVEVEINSKLNILFEEFCNKINTVRIEMFKKDTLLQGNCAREKLKYKSAYERSQQMSEKVHKINLQN